MKTTIQKKIRSDIPGFSALAALLLALSPAQTGAETVAYWRFDGDGTRVPTPGAWMRDTASRTTIDGRGIAAVDVSGNGNHLYAWSTGGSGFQYKADVSASVIPQTGENNQFSIQNAGSFPCAFTWSAKTLPAG
ncbi:MAG TPA: hypothetical protein VK327_01055, partial [Candidatus Paceibacterota bacterium]|nr:hypothetical protein [Candidatus Paceibacterota bacterium]